MRGCPLAQSHTQTCSQPHTPVTCAPLLRDDIWSWVQADTPPHVRSHTATRGHSHRCPITSRHTAAHGFSAPNCSSHTDTLFGSRAVTVTHTQSQGHMCGHSNQPHLHGESCPTNHTQRQGQPWPVRDRGTGMHTEDMHRTTQRQLSLGIAMLRYSQTVAGSESPPHTFQKWTQHLYPPYTLAMKQSPSVPSPAAPCHPITDTRPLLMQTHRSQGEACGHTESQPWVDRHTVSHTERRRHTIFYCTRHKHTGMKRQNSEMR